MRPSERKARGWWGWEIVRFIMMCKVRAGSQNSVVGKGGSMDTGLAGDRRVPTAAAVR